MGKMWYFGKKDKWETILTSEKIDVSNSLVNLLNSYINHIKSEPKKKLRAIVDDWNNTNLNDRTWKHYFMKYQSFTSQRNYYVWPHGAPNDWGIRMLGTEGPNPLVANHISPYVLTVCKIINNDKVCNIDDCYQQYSGHSPLVLENGLILTCTPQGWKIKNQSVVIPSGIINKFQIEENEGNYQLKEIDLRDRVEIAVDFINDILKL